MGIFIVSTAVDSPNLFSNNLLDNIRKVLFTHNLFTFKLFYINIVEVRDHTYTYMRSAIIVQIDK